MFGKKSIHLQKYDAGYIGSPILNQINVIS